MVSKFIKKNNGFTLIEIIIVIAVLGIISAITVPRFSNAIAKSKISTDKASLKVLNLVTMYYAEFKTIVNDDIFYGFNSDEDRMQELVDSKYLDKLIQPQMKDTEFNWDIDRQKWLYSYYEVPSEIDSHLIFGNLDLVDYTRRIGTWKENDEGFTSGYGALFIDNPKDEYTITTKAKLRNDKNGGGYGVFFETSINDENKDTGYVLQFDRGIGNNGAIIIRERVSGCEFPYIQEFKFDSDNSGGIVLNKSTPEGANWWTQTHDVKLKVNKIPSEENKKNLSVWIDDELLFDNFDFESDVDSSNNFTGFRSWRGEITYQEMTIE